jgi:hypothetical protein
MSRAKEAPAVGPGTARETTYHGQGGAVLVRSSAGITAPGYRGHVAGHGFHGASHSDHPWCSLQTSQASLAERCEEASVVRVPHL